MAGAGPGAGGGRHGGLRASLRDVGSTRPREADTGVLGGQLALRWHRPPPACDLLHPVTGGLRPWQDKPRNPQASRGCHPRTRQAPAPLGGGGPAMQVRQHQSHATATATPWEQCHAARGPWRPSPGHRGHCWSQAPGREDGVAGALPLRTWCRGVTRPHSGLLGLGQPDRSPIGQRGPNPEPEVRVLPRTLPPSWEPSPPPSSEPRNPTLCRCRLEPVREAPRVSGASVKRPPL